MKEKCEIDLIQELGGREVLVEDGGQVAGVVVPEVEESEYATLLTSSHQKAPHWFHSL